MEQAYLARLVFAGVILSASFAMAATPPELSPNAGERARRPGNGWAGNV